MTGNELLDMLMRYQSSAQGRAMTPEQAKATAKPVSRESMVKALDEYIDVRIMQALRRNKMVQE